jgi:hypothetical protein
LALLQRGVEFSTFLAAAPQALGKAHPFPWLIAKVAGQLTDTQTMKRTGSTAPHSSLHSARAATVSALTGSIEGMTHATVEHALDVESRIIDSPSPGPD